MAVNTTSTKWLNYVQHVLKWEGKTSSYPGDKASACYPGGIHTNKGVTYCTFKKYAESLKIVPVDHDRFLKLTDEEVGRFIYRFYQMVKGDKFSDDIALSLTEAAWLSGPGNAAKSLQRAINKLGGKVSVDGAIGPATIDAANKLDQKKLYEAFWADREAFLKSIPNSERWQKGWMNRLNSYLSNFPYSAVTGIGLLLVVAGIAYWYLSKDNVSLKG